MNLVIEVNGKPPESMPRLDDLVKWELVMEPLADGSHRVDFKINGSTVKSSHLPRTGEFVFPKKVVMTW
jgi:hypothetical protein